MSIKVDLVLVVCFVSIALILFAYGMVGTFIVGESIKNFDTNFLRKVDSGELRYINDGANCLGYANEAYYTLGKTKIDWNIRMKIGSPCTNGDTVNLGLMPKNIQYDLYRTTLPLFEKYCIVPKGYQNIIESDCGCK